MIGIDIARIKRWYVKTYPQFAGTGYKIVVVSVSQTSIDTTHSLDGVDLSFTVSAYNAETNIVAENSTKTGTYSRKHYGGWSASETAVPGGGE